MQTETVALLVAAVSLIAGIIVNNPRAAAAVRVVLGLLGIYRDYRQVIADGDPTPAEEQAIGKATVCMFHNAERDIAIVENGYLRQLLAKV